METKAENWIDLFKKAPAEVQHACRRVMKGKTTAKFETERLGERNFEHPPIFNHIMVLQRRSDDYTGR